jgi:hypothetical protein
MQTAKQGTRRQWKPIETPDGITEFGTRNQAHADFTSFRDRHNLFFDKYPEIIFSERNVVKKIKGERHKATEYRATLKTSLSFFKGNFVGTSLVSREAAMKIAVDLANEKFPNSRKVPKKERRPGVVKKMFGRFKSKQII